MHVGLGYPLILPFIVQCIIAKDRVILIEEPEVHLHPKIEADLADLITESSIERNNQFIIETHSEDLLLRILKSIRQEKINPDHVSVNYITYCALIYINFLRIIFNNSFKNLRACCGF